MNAARLRPRFFPFTPRTGAAVSPIEVQRFEPGHIVGSFGLHGHYFNEIVVFDRPGGTHIVGGEERQIEFGDIDALGTGQLHDASNFGAAHGWMLLFHDDALVSDAIPDGILTWFSRPGELQQGRCRAEGSALKRIFSLLAAIEAEQTHQNEGFRAAIRSLFSLLVIELGRLNGSRSAPDDGRVYRYLRRLISIVDDNIESTLTLAFLAEQLELSGGYLTTEIRRATGRTVMDWVLQRRMHEARRRLLETSDSIETIANALKFEDSSHFARRFRILHGSSPAKWRSMLKS